MPFFFRFLLIKLRCVVIAVVVEVPATVLAPPVRLDFRSNSPLLLVEPLLTLLAADLFAGEKDFVGDFVGEWDTDGKEITTVVGAAMVIFMLTNLRQSESSTICISTSYLY